MKNAKKSDWLVYLLVVLTSSTTVLTMSDGTLFGFLRGILFAAVLDGLIIYWERSGEEMKDETQRKYSRWMKWGGIAMLLVIAAAYAFVSVVPVDAVQNVDVFGVAFSTTVREFIHWCIVGAISLWTVLTLAVSMYIRELDPETVMKMEYTKAEETRSKEKLNAYKIANKFTAALVGKEEALEEYRRDLVAANRYTEGEIELMVMNASQEIDRQKLIPVDVRQNTYHSKEQDVTGNFTQPPTKK